MSAWLHCEFRYENNSFQCIITVCLTMADISASEPESQGALERAKNAYTYETKHFFEPTANYKQSIIYIVHIMYQMSSAKIWQFWPGDIWMIPI